MMTPTAQGYTTSTGKKITLDKRLGGGGEGEVWSILGSREVTKLYHPRVIRPEHELKLKAMVANPPVDEMRLKGHVSIAWPTELLYRNGKFTGFLMPMLDKSPTIFSVYNPVRRHKDCPGFNWKYLLHTALNLSKAVEAIHYKHYVIGDLNESNVLVNASALVSIIDTDSFQVRDANGQVYHCKVGKEDFTPPELVGVRLETVDRLPEHDYFSLGVLIFRLLMEGFYPFSGVLKQDQVINEPVQYYCLKKGAFPYVSNPLVNPPLLAPRFESLHREVRNLFLSCFIAGHKNLKARPSPGEWVQALEKAEQSLAVCKTNKEHYYWRHLARCPWCEREAARQKIQLQTPLPPARMRPTARSKPAVISTRPASAPARPFTTPINPASSAKAQANPSFRIFKPLRDTFKKALAAPGGRLNLRTWWLEVRSAILIGGTAGVGLAFLIYLLLMDPAISSYAAGMVAGGVVLIPTYFLARFFHNLRFIQGRGLGILTLLAGITAAAIAGIQAASLARSGLAGIQPHAGWVFLDGLLLGSAGGTAYGSYRVLSRRKSQLVSIVVALLIIAATVALMGLFALPF
jgi:hypothetical protein